MSAGRNRGDIAATPSQCRRGLCPPPPMRRGLPVHSQDRVRGAVDVSSTSGEFPAGVRVPKTRVSDRRTGRRPPHPYGCPNRITPAARVHPIVNDQIIHPLQPRDITAKGDVAESGRHRVFDDGSEEQIEWCFSRRLHATHPLRGRGSSPGRRGHPQLY